MARSSKTVRRKSNRHRKSNQHRKYNRHRKSNRHRTSLIPHTPPRIQYHQGCRLLVLPVKDAVKATVSCYVRLQHAYKNSICGAHHLLEHVLVTGGWKKCGETPCSEVLAPSSISISASVTSTIANYTVVGPEAELQTMLSFITNIMMDPKITRQSILREKPAVLAEIKPKRSLPSTALYQSTGYKFYGCQEHIDAGDMACHIKALNRLDVDDMSELHAKVYVRSAMLFVVSGPASKTTMSSMFDKTVQSIGCLPPIGRAIALCRILKPRYHFYKTKDGMARISLGFDSSVRSDSALTPLFGFVTYLLAGDLPAFLYTVLRTKLKKVYSVSCQGREIGKKAVSWVYTSCSPSNARITLEALTAALHHARNGGIPLETIQWAKEGFILSLRSGCWISPVYVAGFYAPQFITPGTRVVSPTQLIRMIQDLTPQKIAELLCAYFPEKHCSITLGAPKPLSVPLNLKSGLNRR